MRLLLRCLFTSALFVMSALYAQTTIHVPADMGTIQAGIDAAAAGDTVLVAPGTYYENIDFKGKAITVTSSGGAAVTIIDGGGKGNAVTFVSGEGRSSILSSLTITHGGTVGYNNSNNNSGAGIHIVSSRPTLLNNVITANYCQNVFSWDSGPLIQGNTISASATWQKCGNAETGGIYLWGDYQKQSGAPPYGTTVASVVGNTIEDNATGELGDGGGDGGAGIAVWGGSPVILGNIIRNNIARSGQGGGINLVYGTNIAIVQNLIYGNQAGCGGGAISGGLGTLIANNTIVDNTQFQGGGGYSNCEKSAQLFEVTGSTYVNNIIVGNTSSPVYECNDLYIFNTYSQKPSEELQAILDHNLFQNMGGSVLGSTCIDVTNRYGNLVAAPQFVNASSADYHVPVSSPAVDAGNGSVLALLNKVNGLVLSTDMDGKPREQDATGKGYPAIDMGAYEFNGTVSGLPPTRIVMSLPQTDFFTGKTTPLTATLSSLAGVPTGTVTFLVDEQPFTTSTITAGVAPMDTTALRPGLHSIIARYPGQGAFAPAVSVVLILKALPYSTQLSIKGTPNPSIVGQTVTVTVTASSADPGYVPSPLNFIVDGGQATQVTPDASGVYRYSTSSLTAGSHYFSVNYTGDTEHTYGSAQYTQQVMAGYPVNVLLTSSLNPSIVAQTVTLTARVTAQNSSNGTPAGSVQFLDGSSSLGSLALDVNGSASVSVSTFTAGPHTITATYVPSNTFAVASAMLQQTVHGITPLIGFSVLPVTAPYGTPRTALAIITAPSVGKPAPTGFVTFCYVVAGGSTTCNGSNLGRAAVTGSGYATITNLPNVGTNIYGCTYSGDAVYDAGDCTPVVTTTTVATSAVTLSASPNPSPALTPVRFTGRLTFNGMPAASATVNLVVNGVPATAATTDASGNYAASVTLAAGARTIAVTYAADGNHTAASATVGEIVTSNPTSTALTVSPANAIQGVAEAFTVTVTALAGTASPNGTVAVFDGSTLLGQTLAAAPVLGKTVTAVTLTSTFNTAGDHVLTAVYTPVDANFLASSSAAMTLPVAPRNFTVTLDPASLTIQTEHHKTLNVTLSSIGGLTGRIGLACGALPDTASCTWSQNTVTLPANGTVSTQVTVDTDAVLEFKASSSKTVGVGLALAGMSPFALLLLRRRRGLVWLPVLLLSAGCALLSGCSGQYPAHTRPGTYTVPIVATSGDASAPSRTTNLVLTVTP